ncbi:MAG: DEAD/DEAH box helicase [Flavobacteriales bacterium]|nr:DEAD/DEAH box helicase [Flavobacteriales bacterium]
MHNRSNNRNKPKQGGRKRPNQGGAGRGRGRQGGGFKKSTLDPTLLIRKGVSVEFNEYRSDRLIKDLPVDSLLIEALLDKGFERPTEIQDKTLEALLESRDLLGIAKTGTGKTGAFLIPIIHQLIQHNQKPFALVVVPTRELAIQVEEEFKSMTKNLKLYSACFIGGTNINSDIRKLNRACHVIIATPGRLLDLVTRKQIDLRKFNTLILDEFDRMLDMGFVHDVKRIIHGMQQRKHTLLFSATMDKKQKELIADILTDPVSVKLSDGESTGDHIDQDIIRITGDDDKFKILCDMINGSNVNKVLVFEETKHKVNKLCTKLNKTGIKSDQIQGNKSQNARQRALKAFKNGSIKVLVATDVAARGIDVEDISHVFNYQVPLSYDSYIHRIGRTGRAGKSGKAFTFVD